MTKQQKSGGTNNIFIEGDVKELQGGDGVQVDKDTSYEFGADLATEGAPIIDEGTGKRISIRLFEFKMNPEMLKRLPSKQELFNAHTRQISTILWSDGLQPLEEIAPRVIIDVKKGGYKIFVPCEGRLGQVFIDKAENLSEKLVRESTRHKK